MIGIGNIVNLQSKFGGGGEKNSRIQYRYKGVYCTI